MRIFIDTSARWNSGFETHLTQFLSNFDKVENNVELIIYGHNELISKMIHLSQKVKFVVDNNIPENSFKAMQWRKHNIPKLLSYYAPDIHFNLMGWMQHRKKNIIGIGMNRNLQPFIPEAVKINPFFSKEYFRLKLYKQTIIKSYNKCDGIIFNSEFAREIIQPYINPEVRTTVIHHGVNEKFFCTPRSQVKTDNLSILYISDFYPYKNQDILIQAVNKLRKSFKLQLKLNLIGQLNDSARIRIDRVLKQVDNPSSWLKFHNKVPNNLIREHLVSNDIFVFASSVESFGHTLIEAMAAGLPIICSDKRPMKDLLGNNAITVNETDIEEMAGKIFEFVQDPELRSNQANEAYKRAKKFSYEKMTMETLNYLNSFI